MKTKFPTTKSENEINFYIDNGHEFGDVLHLIKDQIKFFQLKCTSDIEKCFERAVSFHWPLVNCRWPFEDQKNMLEEAFGHKICVSVNDCIAHGKPSEDVSLKIGDIVSVDCGLSLKYKDNWLVFDSAFTVTVGPQEESWVRAPLKAIKRIQKSVNNKVVSHDTYGIAKVIQSTASDENLDVVVALGGHGIGYNLHEEPCIYNATGGFVPVPLIEGMCFCVEPIFILPNKAESVANIAKVYYKSDGWAVNTTSKQPGSHFETMFCYKEGRLIDLVGLTKWST